VKCFNGRFYNECMSEQRFFSSADTRELMEHWRRDCNAERLHLWFTGRISGELLLSCGRLTPSPDVSALALPSEEGTPQAARLVACAPMPQALS
jgi:hypothetical protein